MSTVDAAVLSETEHTLHQLYLMTLQLAVIE